MNAHILLALGALLIGGSFAAAEPERSTLAQAAPLAATAACSMIYKPVCGHDKNGKQTTYSNECMAKAAGATGISPGPCMADVTR